MQAIIEDLKQKTYTQVFTVYVRYLIGSAFVIAAFGMGKFNSQELAISNPGAPIETLQPLQQFFRVMSTSGLYWNFIGLSQLVGGALLMTQRFAKLGAVIFFPLILNIFIITVSFGFQGTPVVTGLMLLAATYLLMWDLESFQYILRTPVIKETPKVLAVHDSQYWTYIGLTMLTSILMMQLLRVATPYQLLVCFFVGLTSFFIFFFVTPKFRKVHA